MSWTRTGTVSLTNGSAVVYGAGTTWASDKITRAGDTFKAPDGRDYELLSVQSNTQLTLTSPYLGTTASGQTYALIHTGLLPAELAVAISDLQSKYLATVSQLYEWETSTAGSVPLTNLATGITSQVKPIAGLIADLGSKAPSASPTFSGNVLFGPGPTGVARVYVAAVGDPVLPTLITQNQTAGLAAGSKSQIAAFVDSRGSNNDGLKVYAYRDTTATSNSEWEKSSFVLERIVDSAPQSGLKFGPSSLSVITSGIERVVIDATGNTAFGGVNSTGAKVYSYAPTFAPDANWGKAALVAAGQYGGGIALIDSAAGFCFRAQDSGATLTLGQGSVGSPLTDILRIGAGKNILSVGGGCFGYGTGSGGTVTQATSKSTSVTLNKPSGQITMNNESLAAGAVVNFTLYNSTVVPASVVNANVQWGVFGGPAQYTVTAGAHENGGVILVSVKNIGLGALSDPLKINFAIFCGATA